MTSNEQPITTQNGGENVEQQRQAQEADAAEEHPSQEPPRQPDNQEQERPRGQDQEGMSGLPPCLDLDFLKERYKFELERKKDLTSALSLPVGILGILGSSLVYLTNGFSYEVRSVAVWFLAFVCLSCGLFIAAVVWLVRSYWGYDYEYIPSPGVLRKYRDDLRDYYQQVGGNDGSTEAEVRDLLERKLIEATDANLFANNSKSGYLHVANGLIIGVLVSTALSGAFYIGDRNLRSHRVPEIRVVNMPTPAEKSMTEEKKKEEEKKPPEKPAEPKNTILREGEQPKKEKR